jgi:hypothetical protein
MGCENPVWRRWVWWGPQCYGAGGSLVSLSRAAPNKALEPTASSVIATRGREFYCWTQQEAAIQSGVVSPVPEPGGRRWQRRGIKHAVHVLKASGTLEGLRDMVGMDNVSEALV